MVPELTIHCEEGWIEMSSFRVVRLAATAGVLVSALAVAGCSATAEKGSTDGKSGPIRITYLHRLPDGAGMTKVADLVAVWNREHPDIQVTATKFDGKAAEMQPKLEADVQAGIAPCLAQVGYADLPALYSKGMLVDVTKQAAKYRQNFAPGAFSLMSPGGVTVGLPQDTGPLVYYYNKSAFESLGLSVPTTLAEFTATAQKAAAKGRYIGDFEADEAPNWLSAQAAAAGASWYSAQGDAWKVNVDDAASATVASFWQHLMDTKSVLVQNRWGDGFKAALVNQTLIGTIGAAWEAPLLASDMAGTKNEGQWAVAQLPAFDKTAMTGPDGGSGVAVLKGCPHVDQAMAFDNWFNSQIDGLVSQGLVVAASGTMKTPPAIGHFFGGQDVFAALSTANQHLSPHFGYIPTFPAVAADITKAASQAANGGATVAQVFRVTQESSVKSLKDAGLPVSQ